MGEVTSHGPKDCRGTGRCRLGACAQEVKDAMTDVSSHRDAALRRVKALEALMALRGEGWMDGFSCAWRESW